MALKFFSNRGLDGEYASYCEIFVTVMSFHGFRLIFFSACISADLRFCNEAPVSEEERQKRGKKNEGANVRKLKR